MYLGCCVIDNLLCSQVALVSDEKLVHIFAGIAIDFLQPLLDIVERLLCQTARSHMHGKMGRQRGRAASSQKN